MSTGTESTESTSAKAAIDNATAAGSTGATTAAPAESTTGAAPATAPVNAFAAEDDEIARLEKLAVTGTAGGKATEKDGTTGVAGTETATAASAAAAGGKTDAGTAKAATTTDATAAAAAAAKNPETGAIIALRRKNQEQAAEILIQKGQISVLAKFAQPGATTAEAGGDTGTTSQPTAEEARLQELEAERERIAGEVDLGRMTMLEYSQATNKIDRDVRAITLEQATAIVEANAQPANDLGLEEHLVTLPTKYPVLTRLTVDQLKPFEGLAYEAARLAGKPITPGSVGTKELRERIGALATSFYGTADEKAKAAGGTTGATTATTSSGTATAAQREAKLELAATHPPDIGNTGSGNTGGEPTDAQAEAALAQGEDAAIRWMEKNPGFVSKQMRGVATR